MARAVRSGLITGLVTGVVHRHRGDRAEGGPIGVGRAVSQAVVIAFVGVWMCHLAFTTLGLDLNPHRRVHR